MSTDARRRLSLALVIAGAALLVVGGMALYAREEVFDADRFSQTGSDELRDAAVRNALAEPIVEQIVDIGPDELVNAQPLLQGAVSGALETGGFRRLFRDSVRELHRALFERDRNSLVLTISDLNVVVVEAVRALNPKLAKKIPDDVGRRLVEVTDSEPALKAARVAEGVRVLGLVLPPLGFLLLAGGVAVGGDRRRSLVNACAAVATAAAVGLVALLVARTLLLRSFSDETVHDAAAALFDAYADGLSDWLLLGGVVAVAFAAAATARDPQPLERPRRLLRWIARTPEHRAARVARALAIGLFSVIAFLEPTLALQIVAVFAGAVGLYWAVVELIAAIAPRPGERERATELLRGQRRWVPAAVGILVLAVAVFIAIRLTDEDERDTARPAGPVRACNGYPELCDRTLEDVAFPATHNAMSAAELPGWFTPNQRRGIRRQLDDGIRALLIDTHYGISRKSGPVLTDLSREGKSKVLEGVREELGPAAAERFQSLSARFAQSGEGGTTGAYLCHVVCELGAIPLAEALGWVRDFLETHPDEVLILFIEDKVSPQDSARVFEDAGLVRYAYAHRPGTPLPTLRQMIEADKRLLVMAEVEDGGPAIPWYHAGFRLTQETPYTFTKPKQLARPASCAPNRGGLNAPLFQLNHWIEQIPRSPDTAQRVNSFDFLLRRARDCGERRGLLANLLAVDFYDRGDVIEVARVLNGLPRDAQPSVRTRD